MTDGKITFADEFRSALLSQEKTQTLRYNLSSVPSVGDVLVVYLAESSEKLGFIEITDVESVTVSEVPNREFTGHRNYRSSEELLSHLDNYYNDTITESDTLTLLTFTVVENEN